MKGLINLQLSILCALLSSSSIVSFISKINNYNNNKITQAQSLDTLSTDGFTDFFRTLHQSLEGDRFKSLSIKWKKRKVDLLDEESQLLPKLVLGRYVQLKAGLRLQLTYKYPTNDQVKNYEPQSITQELLRLIKENDDVTTCSIIDTENEFKWLRTKDKNSFSLQTNPVDSRALESTSLAHDRQKNALISVEEPFLKELKVTTSTNSKENKKNEKSKSRPLVGMASKLKQIQKFVEILDTVIARSFPDISENDKNQEISDFPVKIVDMGCGKGYLTFAVHSHFEKKFKNLKTLGVEARRGLVTETEQIARKLKTPFLGLTFRRGSIDSFVKDQKTLNNLTDQSPKPSSLEEIMSYSNKNKLETQSQDLDLTDEDISDDINVLIALHACDTATDEAIWAGITHNAQVIVTAPCCQKELRPQLDERVKRAEGGGGKKESVAGETEVVGLLDGVLRHGIFRERQAEMLTDGLRASLLQWVGYDTQVIEFVTDEHTFKNVMIIATKRHDSPEADPRDEELANQIRGLMKAFGIRKQRLADLIGFS